MIKGYDQKIKISASQTRTVSINGNLNNWLRIVIRSRALRCTCLKVVSYSNKQVLMKTLIDISNHA